MPFFSIILPTYNRSSFIPQAIDSVLGQIFTDWELIIIDDGSTDNTKQVVGKYNDERIKYIYQENQERSAARNKGIEKSSGEYICFLDSDDYYLENHLQEFNFRVKTDNFPVAFLFSEMSFKADNKIITSSSDKFTYKNNCEFIIQKVIGSPQVCIHNKILQKHRFRENFHVAEDLELWLRIVKDYPLIHVSGSNVVARIHDDRTVNYARYNSAYHMCRVLKYVFLPEHSRKYISGSIRNNIFSNCYYNIAKHYIYNNKRTLAIYYLILSLLRKPNHIQSRHRLYLIFILFPFIRYLFRNKQLIDL